MLRSDCVLQKMKRTPKTYFLDNGATCVYMVFSHSEDLFKKGFAQKSSEFHGGKMFVWLLRHVGVRSSMWESRQLPNWHRPAAFLHISYKGATPTRSNDFQTRKCKHPVCAPGERSSSRRPLLRRSGWAISGAFPRQVPRRSAVVYKANSLQPKNQQPTTMQ